jgi:prefoldin beta subunit
LTPNNVVFKLVGPVLVKQDQVEAKSNVDKRLEFIGGEIKRIEAQLQEIEQKSEKKKSELVEIQTELQQRQKPDGSGAPAAST